jgi:hypothetical protein
LRIVLVALLTALAPFAAAQSPEQVNRAIENGVNYLRSRQGPHGGWEEISSYPGGVTALATLALLSCGAPPDDPDVDRAVRYLERAAGADGPKDTYVVALYTMVFAEVDANVHNRRIERYAKWLMDSQLPNGRWTYGTSAERVVGSGDNSNTQFAMLGLHAASQAGVRIPRTFWDRCRTYWAKEQARSGAWGYTPGSASGSMTAAGVASLIIANREWERAKPEAREGRPIRCSGTMVDEHVQRGLEWMGRNFSVRLHPGGNNMWYYYYLYGLERAGRLSGQRFFGEHDWYRVGVRALTSSPNYGQRPDGSWGGQVGDVPAGRIINTSFALLFLSKGRIPILVNKLMHGPGQDWNNAPNDVNNLTNFLAQKWSVKLNWQTVDPAVATVEDLLQAPILQFSGHEAPQFSPKEKQLLRQYVQEGGVLLVDANCSFEPFDRGFRELCKELFPEDGQQLRRIDPEHGVWTSLFELQPDWPLWGIDVGCRTAVFYSPEDLSCHWEFAEDKDSLPAVRLGANIVAYAAGPEDLKDKLEERKSFEDVPEDPIRRNYLQIAKIRHNGDWNPAPLAVRNLMLSLRDAVKIDVVAQERPIDLLDPNLVNYPLAYMHGRTRFQFDRKEKEALAEYLANGGVLLADACCGNEKFDESFRALAAELFPDRPLAPIPSEHEIFTTKIGYDLRRVQYGPGLDNRSAPPLLEGIDLEGRYAVIYSKYDIGCALQRQQSRDCKGYTHESAVQIAANVALYALKQ